jgi:ferredoxin-type protein NapF
MNKHLSPSKIRPVSTLLAIIFALPLSWGVLTGFYAWLSPFIMLNSVLLLKSFYFMNLVALLVLIISVVKKRFFCNFICPTGYLCDRVSGLSPYKHFVHRKMPDISGPVAILSVVSALAGLPLLIFFDPLSMFNGFFTVFRGNVTSREIIVFSTFPVLLVVNFVLPGIWCSKICPLGGLQNLIYGLRTVIYKKPGKEEKQNTGISLLNRRYFISAGAGLTAGILIPGFLKPRPESVIRPPGSTDPGVFNILCIRCGNCIKSCPTGIITRNSGTASLMSFMTPVISFTDGYCLETCNNCGIVCPTGSIASFSISQKKNIIIGKAVIRLNGCLLLNNKECNRCKVSCSYNAIKYKYSEELMATIPVVTMEQCTGCGACYVMCPPGVIEVIKENGY